MESKSISQVYLIPQHSGRSLGRTVVLKWFPSGDSLAFSARRLWWWMWPEVVSELVSSRATGDAVWHWALRLVSSRATGDAVRHWALIQAEELEVTKDHLGRLENKVTIYRKECHTLTCFCIPPLMPVLGISRSFLTSFRFRHTNCSEVYIVHTQQLPCRPLTSKKEAYVCMLFSVESRKYTECVDKYVDPYNLNWIGHEFRPQNRLYFMVVSDPYNLISPQMPP